MFLLSPGSRGAHLTWTPLPGQRTRGFALDSIFAAAEQNMQDDPAGRLSRSDSTKGWDIYEKAAP